MSCVLHTRLVTAGALVCALATGCCAHTPPPPETKGPDEVALEYARALRDGRLDDAYALTSKEYRATVSAQAFKARYTQDAVRAARADAISKTPVRAVGAEMSLVRDGKVWRVAGESEGDARAVADAFVKAAAAGEWKKAYSFLAAPLRARYSPERFAEDFKAEPQAKERLTRARVALEGTPELVGNEVRFMIGEGRALRLIREADGFRILAIE